MEYRIKHREEFAIFGKLIELSHSQKQNILLSKIFWNKIDSDIENLHLFVNNDWQKDRYMFTTRSYHKLLGFYCFPIGFLTISGFITRTIPEHDYLVFEHHGLYQDIPLTYNKIYRHFLPQHSYQVDTMDCLHFEKFRRDFYWNDPHSVVEIWIPIKNKEHSN